MIDTDARARDRAAAAEWARDALADDAAVILDTETTDLRGYICDIAVIRATDGEVLMDRLVNPLVPIEPGAQAVHGITDADARYRATFAELWGSIQTHLCERRVLVWNAAYDEARFLAELGRLTPGWAGSPGRDSWGLWECIMLQHAAWVGERNDYRESYRWHKLAGGDHRALGDCRAARARLIEMAGGETPV